MGCDVHPLIQVRQGSDNYRYWISVAIPDRSRCYPFFVALAGVRQGYGDGPEGDPIFEPRGLPKDFNQEWGISEAAVSGDHSDSWFTLAEMRAYDAAWLRKVYTNSEWPFQLWQRWLDTMEFFRTQYRVEPEDVRVVFNFDS